MRVLLAVLFVLALLALVCVAIATPRATAAVATTLDQGTIRGSPPTSLVMATTPTHYATLQGGNAGHLAPIPTARTGPHYVAYIPCARDYELVGFIKENTYCDELCSYHPIVPTLDNSGDRHINGNVDHYYNMPAAFA